MEPADPELQRNDSRQALIDGEHVGVPDVEVRGGGSGVRELSSLLSQRNMTSYAKTSRSPPPSAPTTLASNDRRSGNGGGRFGGRKRSRSTERQKITNGGEVANEHELPERPSTSDAALPLRTISTQLDADPVPGEGVGKQSEVEATCARSEASATSELSSLLSKRNLKSYHAHSTHSPAPSAPTTLVSRDRQAPAAATGSSRFGGRKRNRSVERTVIKNPAAESSDINGADAAEDPRSSNADRSQMHIPLRSISTELGQGYHHEDFLSEKETRMESGLHSHPNPDDEALEKSSLAVALDKWIERHPEHVRSLSRNESLRSVGLHSASASNVPSRSQTPSEDAMLVDAVTVPQDTQHLSVGGKDKEKRSRSANWFRSKKDKSNKTASLSAQSTRRRSPSAFHAFLTLSSRGSTSSKASRDRKASRVSSVSRLKLEEHFDGPMDDGILDSVRKDVDVYVMLHLISLHTMPLVLLLATLSHTLEQFLCSVGD